MAMHTFEARRATHEALRDATVRLIAEFSHLPAGSVIASVARAREELLRSGVREGLAVAAEAMARARLASLHAVHAV